MTGWRLGLSGGSAVRLAQSRGTPEPERQQCVWGSPVHIGAIWELAAFRGSRECVQAMVVAFAQRRQVLLQALESMEDVHGGRAWPGAIRRLPFSACLHIAANNLSSAVFCERLPGEAGVAIVPGAAFDHDHAVRLSFATDITTLKRGLERLQAFPTRL